MKLAKPQLNEAILFEVPLDATAEEIRRFESTLSRDELARADRFLMPELRKRFVKCRGVLRAILGEFHNESASDLRFRYEQWGKPRLQSPNSLLHFNVSHSANHALIAIAQSDIGVDLELPTGRVNYSAIASQVLSEQERATWKSLSASERDTAIMQLWVCKEAILKAMGLGIAEGLTQVSFSLPIQTTATFQPTKIDAALLMHLDDDGTCRTNHWTDISAWRMRMVPTQTGGFAAIATSPAIKKISVQSYLPPEPHF